MKNNANLSQRFRVVEFQNASGSTSFRVTGSNRDGKQVRENYASRDEAEARRIALDAEYYGREAGIMLHKTRLTAEQLAVAESSFLRLESNEEMTRAIDHWLAVGKKSQQEVEPKRLDAAFEAYCAYLDSTDEIRQRTKIDKKSRANSFVRTTPNVNITEITPQMIDAYLDGLNASKRTKINHRTKIGEFFAWCCKSKQGFLTVNPVKASTSIKVPKGSRPKPPVIDIKHCRLLLHHAMKHNGGSLAPYMAVCLLAGLRPESEAARLTWANVNLDDKEITVDPTNKTGHQRTIEIPPVLLDWLKRYKGQSFYPPTFRDDFDAIRKASGFSISKEPEAGKIPWVEDFMRHTAVSHFLRKHKSYGEAADYFDNSETVIRKHYKGRVSKADAAHFYKLTPKEVARKAKTPANVVKLTAAA